MGCKQIRLSLGETVACDYHVIITQRFDRAQDWAQPSAWQWGGSINIRVWNSITSANLPAFPLREVHKLLMKAQGCKKENPWGSETRSRPLEKSAAVEICEGNLLELGHHQLSVCVELLEKPIWPWHPSDLLFMLLPQQLTLKWKIFEQAGSIDSSTKSQGS